MNSSLVSIIIPTFNRAELIGETLDSVMAQTNPNWECILVDDGSIDDTVQRIQNYLKKDQRFKLYYRPNDYLPGGNGARNFGLKKSNGSYIQWFDSDDLMEPNYLEKQVENIRKTNADFSICLMQRYNHDFSVLQRKAKLNIIQTSLYVDFVCRKVKAFLQTILWKREFINDFSLDENLLKSQEYDFLARVFFSANKNFTLLNESLVKVRRHQDSITGEDILTNKEKLVSGLKVRENILNNITTNSFAKKTQLNYLFLYLQFLKNAIISKRAFIFYKYLFKCFKVRQINAWILIFKIAISYPLFLLTKKGATFYATTINKLRS